MGYVLQSPLPLLIQLERAVTFWLRSCLSAATSTTKRLQAFLAAWLDKGLLLHARLARGTLVTLTLHSRCVIFLRTALVGSECAAAGNWFEDF